MNTTTLVDKSDPVPVPLGPSIRDAILDIIPDDPNISRDVKLHDGVADITIKWRTLAWSTCVAIHDQTPEQVAQSVVKQFSEWVRTAIVNRKNAPRYERLLDEMRRWALANPDKAAWIHEPEPEAADETPQPWNTSERVVM